ncbi:zinc ribbon domain-containing protein, partial [Spirulina sp. CS-785/01]
MADVGERRKLTYKEGQTLITARLLANFQRFLVSGEGFEDFEKQKRSNFVPSWGHILEKSPFVLKFDQKYWVSSPVLITKWRTAFYCHREEYCSNCGEKVQKSLSTRTHVCPHCGFIKDRDINAAIN